MNSRRLPDGYRPPYEIPLPPGLGWRQRHMLRFCRRYPGEHYAGPDRDSRRAAESLARRGLLELRDCGMRSANGQPVYIVSAT